MQFNRRGFLITLAGSGFAALTTDALAGAPDRYKRLIDLATQMKAETDRYYGNLEEAVGRPRPQTVKPLWQNDPRPYDEVMKARTAISVEHSKWNRDAAKFRPLFDSQRDAIYVQADHLLNWTMDNFNGPANDETRDQIQALFQRRMPWTEIDILDEEAIRRIEDPLINIVLARTMIHTWRTPLDTQRMTSFHRFAGTYKDLIMG